MSFVYLSTIADSSFILHHFYGGRPVVGGGCLLENDGLMGQMGEGRRRKGRKEDRSNTICCFGFGKKARSQQKNVLILHSIPLIIYKGSIELQK